MRSTGFSLIEVLIATTIVSIGAASLAQLFVVSDSTNRLANTTSIATLLAESKMEELCASPAVMGPSPTDALAADTAGYVEYLDAAGGLLNDSGTTAPPVGTAYIRRWSIDRRPARPVRSVVIQVLVIPVNRSLMDGVGVARLVSVGTW